MLSHIYTPAGSKEEAAYSIEWPTSYGTELAKKITEWTQEVQAQEPRSTAEMSEEKTARLIEALPEECRFVPGRRNVE